MKPLQVFAITFSLLFLYGGSAINNIDVLLPEFNTIDLVWRVPFFVQLSGLLGITILAAILVMKKNRMISSIYIVCFLALPFSWFKLQFSNQENKLIATNFPFYESSIPFEAIKNIEIHRNQIIVNTNNEATTFNLGFYPFGLNSTRISLDLSKYGTCLEPDKDNCFYINFDLP